MTNDVTSFERSSCVRFLCDHTPCKSTCPSGRCGAR
jgi:hypothetical protein